MITRFSGQAVRFAGRLPLMWGVSFMKNPMQGQSFKLRSIGIVLCLAASAFFFWLWYERYLRIDFNELGRYYDPETQIVYTDSAFVWCLPALGFLLFAVVQGGFLIWRRRAGRALKLTSSSSTDSSL